VIEVSISMWIASRLKSSTRVKVLKLRPPSSVSLMKSADQTESGRRGRYSGTRSRFGSRRFAARRRLSFMAQYTR